MLTPEQMAALSDHLIEIYRHMQGDLLVNIASRFDCTEEVTPNTILEWQMRKLEEFGGVKQRNLKIIRSFSSKTDKKVASLFKNAGIKTLEMDEEIYQMAFSGGLLSSVPVPAHASPRVRQAIEAAARSTRGHLNLINTKAFQSANEGYLSIINQAYLETSLGISDYNTAVRKAIGSLAQHGITGADYYWTDANGYQHHRRDQVDVAARRNVLSSVSRMSGDTQMARAKDWGWNFVETSSHMDARPEHAVWQGRVFCLEGETSEYPNFAKATGYGSIEGICGVNCRHTFYPFFPGITERVSQHYNQEKNNKEYASSQEQRKLEREIREQKRRVLAADASKDEQGKLEAQLKLRKKEGELKEFLSDTGRRKESGRSQVYGFGRSEAQQAVQAEKRVAKETEIKYNKAVKEAKASMAATPLKLREGQQKKHILGAKEYNDYAARLAKKGQYGPSFLNGDLEYARELMLKYAGTGEPVIIGGVWRNAETVDIGNAVMGTVVNNLTGQEALTPIMKLHYSQKYGIHIVPDYPSKRRKPR